MKVGIIVACHNRAEKTARWLNSLKQNLPSNWELTLVAIDDGSIDETYTVLNASPLVSKIEMGNGSWFWAKSMAYAEKVILEILEFDFLIWANDDTCYFENALQYVEDTREKFPNAILVGQFSDNMSKTIVYGGLIQMGRHPFRYELVETRHEGQLCDVFNGNFVLIPKSASKLIGAIDGNYKHGYADFDYSKRASALSIEIRILHKPLGQCESNLIDPSSFNTVWKRLKFARSRKGMPIQSHYRYLRKFGPVEWPIYMLFPYVRALFGVKSRK